METIKEILTKSGTDMTTVTKKEFNEAKKYLLNGGKYVNDSAEYFIAFRQDGECVFMLGEKYKFFKNFDAFVRATVRIVKRGY